MTMHNKKGATLGLFPVLLLIVALIGIAMFICAEFFGGNRQLINATDAGALATARNILAVGLQTSEVSALPPEFQALGVDNSGVPTGVDLNTGLANSNAIFNVYAFNRAAGLTLLVALNAAEDGSPAAINNANTLISALNTFGNQLNTDLSNDPSFASAFSNLSSSNQTTMLGSNHISLGNNDRVRFTSIPSDGKANIYFNTAIYDNDPTMANWINQITVNSGTLSQPNNRYNAGDPNAQAGQPFVKGYQPVDMNAVTGASNFNSLIYAAAVSPAKLPHMVDPGRFNSSTVPYSCYAPTNSISTQGQVTEGHTNILCTALGCAMLCAGDNQYPVDMPYGWIRIKNNPDAITSNPTQIPTLPAVPYWISFGTTVFNYELYLGAGGFGGIDLANNGVFCTEAYNNSLYPLDPGPPGYSGAAELTAWITYNTTPCTDPNYKDARGLDMRLDPSRQQNDGSYVFDNVPSPTQNIRATGNYEQLATVNDMLGITSIAAYCNSTMYIDNVTPPLCESNLNTWTTNYHGTNFGQQGPYDTGRQATGGLTNLEYLKGQVLGAFWNFYELYWVQQQTYTMNYTVNPPQLPSGSKVYDRSNIIAYAVPTNNHAVDFGTVSTPGALLNQLYDYNASCANVNDTNQWNDITTPLGKLLQRCKQILPSVTPQDISTLLNTYTIDLNQYQYIYLPAGANKLTISQTPPAFLKPYPEYAHPGSTLPDGNTALTCQDTNWDRSGTYSRTQGQIGVDIFGSAINSGAGQGGDTLGDASTHDKPYLGFSGNLNTYDAVNWTSNSGRNYFLGELSFGNYVNGTGGTFFQPN